MPRPLVLLLLGVLCGGLAFLVHEPEDHGSLQREALRLERTLEAGHAALEDGTAQALSALAELGPEDWMRLHIDDMERARERSGTFYIGFKEDSLVCWSGHLPMRPSRYRDATTPFLRTNAALHLHSVDTIGPWRLHGLRPVWIAPPLENRFLRAGFHPSLQVAKGAAVAEGGSLGPEITLAGEPLFRLAWRDGALETGDWIWIRSLLLILTFIFLITFLWSISMRLVQVTSTWAGIFLFTLVVLGVRWWTLSTPPVPPFDRLPLFDPALYATSFLFPSLGDLLINATLLLVITLFIREAMILRDRGVNRSVSALVAWSVIIGYGAWITGSIIGLVEDSSVDLDLHHVAGLGPMSAVALFSTALFFCSWSIVASLFMERMHREIPTPQVFLTGTLITVVLLVAAWLWGSQRPLLFLWPLPTMLLLFPGVASRAHFIRLTLGIVLVSAITAVILTRYTALREKRERLVLAERLATREDPVVELLFQDIAPRLRTDKAVYALLNTGRACTTTDLDALVRQRFFGGYWERYDVRLFAFGVKGQVLCATDPDPPRSFRLEQSIFTDPRAAADMPDLVMEEVPGQSTFYHARVSIMPVDTLPPAQLIVELYPRPLPQALGFPELLLAGDDPLSRRTTRYTLARYERGRLVEQTGAHAYPLHWDRAVNSTPFWYRENGYEHLVAGDLDGTLLVLGLPEPTLVDRLTTFSYLFTFFSLLLAIAIGARAMIAYRGFSPVGISMKVRLVLILFAATSLLLFSFGTRRLLDGQYMARIQEGILEKALSVHTELQQRLDGEPELGPTHAPYLDHLLGRISNVFFTDITLYMANGRMLATSRPQIFTSGLLGRRMDPVAYTEVVLNARSSFIQEESIGLATFHAAYMPLRDRQGNVLAYIALPAFADQRQQEERSSVMIAVVNLFVVLFALSVLVAVFISNWTLRPLDLLKRALSNVALQGTNTPIRYRGEDEVGQLVQVYNQKVQELHESAERLARSERESAWREMARQVAHEIKNPLTPMKLGIQQFQRSWDPAAPDARERLERFSTAMVEQIDTLNGVASAFSQFAHMPVPKPEEVQLNEVVRMAVDVFDALPGTTISLHEEGPFTVLADREHLLRVFNNLLKNAIQAIPDDRMGRIQVHLRRSEEKAVVEVRDNGSGIDDGIRERIFSPSFTTKSSGMGLGLAMVKRIVESTGGQVWFTSSEEGTSFFVALPLVLRPES